MEIPDLFKYYSTKQKDIFTGFCIALPICFTILYLYIPIFKNYEIYLQIIFSITASILSIYISFIFITITTIISRKEFKVDILITILPIIITGFNCITTPDNYHKGYDFIIYNFWKYSTWVFIPRILIGFFERIAKKHDS